MKLLRPVAAVGSLLLLSLAGCAVPRPPESVASEAPPRWYAPLPHGGNLADLRRWWLQFDDPLLIDLIEAAQAANPNVATAATRIAEARSARVAANAARLPSVDATTSISRGNALAGGAGGAGGGGQGGLPASTILQNNVQLAWEVDVFGARRSQSDAARARERGAQAGWHDARVAVAAETATTYVELRTCHLLVAVTRNDARSRAESARLTGLSAEAGFTAPAVAAQARASAAEGAARATQQQAQCELVTKGLVALTGLPEPELRRRLAAGWDEPAGIADRAIPSVPAALLAQRPDVYLAERNVAAASADVGAARADRFPRVSLSGQIATGWIRAGGQASDIQTWQIGPLAVTLPIFDAGRRAAAEDAAQARYEEAVIQYGARVRQAVREVEEALVNLESARERSEDARAAVEGYRASFVAAEARFRSGLGSLIELEDQRRVLLNAETVLVTLQRERVAAWIALYRALGGGWERGDREATARND
ncbi:MAG TPA: efflux transporter outer membrane subunit [Ramlibacter sp.]|uniref:efflux transporter outer membrane subunit n=1 Tax=Ramlibacter sp. TaxID=1917967 RepID=UPI002ED4F9F4